MVILEGQRMEPLTLLLTASYTLPPRHLKVLQSKTLHSASYYFGFSKAI